MKWSLKLGRFAGIDVFVHWTFAILLVWIFAGHLSAGHDVIAALKGIGFVVALFACVVLHEFGHALTARHYGIQTRDITLLPIGGIARLERMPEDPVQELWVALAGPAVNVIIAAMLLGIMAAIHGLQSGFKVELMRGDFVARLMWVNVTLVAFNVLPAFPMDGGRVLRALLARRIGRRRATHIAATVGQGMAILFGIVGMLYNPLLLFIALFVFLGAQGEAQLVELSSVIRGLRVRDAMQTRFRTLSADDPLHVAVEKLLAGAQQDFPISIAQRSRHHHSPTYQESAEVELHRLRLVGKVSAHPRCEAKCGAGADVQAIVQERKNAGTVRPLAMALRTVLSRTSR